jgi:hypothetical protein
VQKLQSLSATASIKIVLQTRLEIRLHTTVCNMNLQDFVSKLTLEKNTKTAREKHHEISSSSGLGLSY